MDKIGNMDTVCSITIILIPAGDGHQDHLIPLHSGNVNLHLTFGIQIPFSILSFILSRIPE